MLKKITFRGLVSISRLLIKTKSVLSLRKTHFIKGDELSTEWTQLVGMLWQRTLGDESEAIKFRCPRRQMWSPQWEPSLTSFWTVTFLTYVWICLKFFWTVASEIILTKKSNILVFVYINLVLWLAVCVISLVHSFPFKYMSCLWSLLWSDRLYGS